MACIAEPYVTLSRYMAPIAASGPGAPSLPHSPSSAEKSPPRPGAWCSCCYGTSWWTERYEPKGWRCATCHPPLHLRPDQLWINDQPAPPPLPEPTGPLL
jgi:hypothetical protein